MMDDQDSAAPPAKRGRGRSPYIMTEQHREKIRNSNILSYLIRHIEGEREMNATQVAAGLGLLKKVLPDLSTTTMQGDEDGGPVVTEVRVTIVDADKP